MLPIYRMKVIQIEITNACNLTCSSCTRFVGHHPRPYYMDLATVERAIRSLDGYEGQIGIMGGEPTIHPEFPKVLELVRTFIPERRKRELWTNGKNWDKYKDIITETFDHDLITYNDHQDKEVGVHQPLLIAAEEILQDRELMWRLIGNCWVQWRWAASITPKGGFFCEVAAAQDMLFEGPGGYPIEKGWWNRNPNEFMDQVKRYCPRCSGAVPMKGVNAHSPHDYLSKGNYEHLKAIGSPKIAAGNYKLANFTLTEEEIMATVKEGWTPWSHRPYKQSGPDERWV